MTEITEHAPGTPSWADIGSPDIAASSAFYSGLFGWTGEDLGEEAGHYTMCSLRGKAVAAIGPAMNPGPPTWSTYFTVDDADATSKLIADAGGTIVVDPMDVMDAGRMAVAQDSTGGFFSIWQPRAHIGAQIVNEPGTLCWNELNTRDVEGALTFYERVFGFTTKRSAEYNEFGLGGRSVAGCMTMPAGVPAEVPSHWLVYFAVDDTDAAAARAAELGGTAMPAIDVPDVGRFAVLMDPLGAVFAVIKMSVPA
jgi:predicted enzyme related to lactoylglutathione lyase